ncbi:hypothetical protein [uncultured Paraglaciecola sp.]|uniref:hypothetical protein n=1 Tax=uncultured Paraglaciecola sp. TaxID=1765024 RepID=UPI002628F69C|nr:hypothetical protein [uncultured Paraglaciecola sp.]
MLVYISNCCGTVSIREAATDRVLWVDKKTYSPAHGEHAYTSAVAEIKANGWQEYQ